MTTKNRVGTQAIDTVATTSNNSSTNNPASDNRTPAPPATLTYSTSLEYTAGSYYAVVSLSWLPATAATDGTKMTPASTEIWQFRPTLGAGGTSVQQFDAPEQQTVTAVTAGKLPVLRTHLKALAGLGKLPKLTTHLVDESQVEVYVSAGSVASPNHAAVLHGYVPGQTWQFKIRAVGTNGKRSVFSNIVEVTMPTVVVAPPEPSKPLLYSDMGVVQVTWDGNSITGAPMPSDLDHLVVQRSVDALFANPYDVMSIFDSGTAIDGPLTVGTTYYYRFQAYNKIGQYGPPGGPPYSSIKVVGIDGGAIAKGTLPSDSFDETLYATIEAAINATAGGSVPGNRVFPPSATPPTDPHPPDDLLRAGDLWPDSGNQMRMKRYDGVGNWIDLRDTIVQAAFSAGGVNAIAAPFLLPAIVQTQVLLAGLIQAKDIIATGSINSAAGLFGTVDAGILNAGVISAQRIDAKSISADKLLIADLTNFIDDPGFTGGDVVVLTPPGPVPPAHTFPVLRWGTSHRLAPAWTTVSSGHIKAVADAPSLSNGTVVTSAGHVWSMLGNATSQSVTNTKTLSVVDTDQFYAEMWVRKISSVVSGTVSLVINLQTPTGPGTMTVLSQTFKATDPVGTWVHLTGFVQPPPAVKLPPTYPPTEPAPAPTLSLLAGSYQLTTSLVVGSSVVAGEVQFASIVLRRKNNTNMIVDGSITAAQIAAQTITGYEIDANTIHSENIFAGTITAVNMWAGTLTAMMVRGDQFWAGGWDPKTGLSLYPGLLITKNSLDYSTSATNSVFHMDFQAGSMIMRSAQATSKSRYEIDLAGIRLYNSSNTKTVELASSGSAFFQGAIDASTFAAMSVNASGGVAGAVTTGARVVLDTSGLKMYDSTNHMQFQLALANGTVFLTSDPTAEAANQFGARWVLKDSGLFFYNGTKMTVGLYSTGTATFSGTITASKLDATNSITGSLIQTSVSGDYPRISLSASGDGSTQVATFWVQDQYGSSLVLFKADSVNTNASFTLDSNPQMTVATHVGHDQPRLLIDSLNYFRFYSGKKNSAGTWLIPFEIDFQTAAITLTSPTIQTSTTNPRLFMNSTEFLMTDDQGNINVLFKPGTTSADSQVRLDTGADTYPRLWIDSQTGLRWFSDSSSPDFQLNFIAYNGHPAGSIFMTGPIVTSGAITGSTVTGGTVQTGTGAIAKVLMAENVGIRGYDTNGSTLVFYINMAGDAWFKGTVAAGSTASGATGSGNTWTGPVLIGGSMSGGIGAGGATITGGIWKSSAGANRIEIAGNTITVVSNNLQGGYITNYATYDDILAYGASNSGSIWLGYNSSAGGPQVRIYNGGSTGHGAEYNFAVMKSSITSLATSGAVYIDTNSGYMGIYTSSVRYKKAVRPLGLASGFMNIETATWSDKPDIGSVPSRVSTPGGQRRSTGFTAENLHKAGMFDSVTYDTHRRPNGIQQPAIMAHTVAYVQHLVRQVQDLTARVAALEGAGV